jgi:hypothetical protein
MFGLERGEWFKEGEGGVLWMSLPIILGCLHIFKNPILLVKRNILSAKRRLHYF